ncbi:MAG: SPOR domain-containing protein [Paracoccaceae bacterium]
MTGRFVLSVALLAGFGWAGPGFSQALKDVDGPAEVPPAAFTGTQYVDSQGCVFVRAGLGGKVTWVPRVTKDRKLMCGQVPTFAAAAQAPAPLAAMAAEPAPAPAVAAPAPIPAAPAAAPAATKKVVAKAKPPARKAAPKEGALLVSVAVVPGGATACVPPPKLAQRFTLSNGRRFLRCAAPVADPLGYIKGLDLPGVMVTGAAPGAVPVKPPAGYVAAWSDDRLNPRRGETTAAGEAAMAAKWTNGTPMRLKPGAVLVKPAKGGRYIQVGAFAVAGNADRAVARVQAAGLPAGRSAAPGPGLTVIFAGPFAAGDIAAALAAVRAAGFADAFVR